MPPSSGELWGHHLMPSQIDVDFLLPNSILVSLRCQRDATLESLKSDLWKEAKKYPLFYLLQEHSSYIFVGITQDAQRVEFYDETRRLCDLRLFQPILKIVEPMGNKEEKMLNTRLGIALGMSVNEFNENKDLEVIAFRRNLMLTCKSTVEERDSQGPVGVARYVYPPDVHSDNVLPKHVQEIIEDGKQGYEILVSVSVITMNNEGTKITLKISHKETPEKIIEQSIRHKVRTMNISAEQRDECVNQHRDKYVLKVCGYEEFLLGDYPLSQYKYVRRRIAQRKIPELMLMSRAFLYKDLPKGRLFLPAYVQKGVGALQDITSQPTTSLWNYHVPLRIKINVATYVNVRDKGEIYVHTGIYHGTESLCDQRDTKSIISSNPKWNEWLEYDLKICDIPRSARLCLSLCSISKKQKRKVKCAIAWANINLFDFHNRLMCDKLSVKLWPMPPGYDDMLYCIGVPGSNTSSDAPCLEIEFEKHGAVSFPTAEEIEEHAQSLVKKFANARECLLTESEEAQIEEIIKRDPLAEISEQEKDLLWKARFACHEKWPNSLSKLLQAVKWSCRDDVAQLYLLLKTWPYILPELSLELLYCTYTDLIVRKFAVSCLEKGLTDDKLLRFLMQLVQVIEFEPHFDNHLTHFLLKRALYSQRIGHFFFWYLRSAMHQPTIRLRFGLILEAYCRSCGTYLRSLCRQVEAIEKLTKLADMLKEQKEDVQLRVLRDQIRARDYLEALQNFPSPLNYNHILGELLVEQCDIKISKKRPLFLAWKNPDQMAKSLSEDFQIIFKTGDDLRQDMLTLQIIGIMDAIWQSEGFDLKMIPYGCLATGINVGMIEVVRKAKTVNNIFDKCTLGPAFKYHMLHNWIKEKTRASDSGAYNQAIDTFTKSCAGYCVATFILGIGDRHPSNIMVTETGQVFHIDFGHFLDHRKKKFGINRERVPFVLTNDFITVIAKGKENPMETEEFKNFRDLCTTIYLKLRRHANIIITLFTMMLSCGIPELQSLDDISYVRNTLRVECKSEQEAEEYFQRQFKEAYGDQWTTRVDWLMHWVKHKSISTV